MDRSGARDGHQQQDVRRHRRTHEVNVADAERVMDVNFWGVMDTYQAFLPHLLKRPVAALVNASSMQS
ncbi:SDR family NAD(P)-dependent oxidoreductase [Propioniciclava sinopodophylli]|uniref:SDR family NAD(P)-dependent oxidoreductase n=1 Tax=Propioniciclava sinopodophylli TaxID=1837344 RepID=UPI00240DDCC5|nr:SDR family NAD(P)-dependent oxidoreductase [Propioniciclava sinopodophylli]